MLQKENITPTRIALDTINYIYFIGIGGIGMSALARYFNAEGFSVSGYDKTSTALTTELSKEGIEIHFNDEPSLVEEQFSSVKSSTLIIYTPAIPSTHKELVFLKNEGFNIIKRSEALGLITQNTSSLAVAGTHGKTTTSSILAHLLINSENAISAFLGGIALNFNSNFIHHKASTTSVVEADEFDRSFLTLYPKGAIITSTDADHLDIYGDKEDLLSSFQKFANQVSQALIIHENSADKIEHPNKVVYGTSENSDYQLCSRSVSSEKFTLSIKTPRHLYERVETTMPGEHNGLNILAAIALGAEMGFDEKKLVHSVQSFKGIQRRFQFVVNTKHCTYIDDYAHHPTELTASILAAKELFPDKKLVGVFQPHLYSRTRDFADGFMKSLSLLDELILLDIYPAREEPISGVTSKWLLEGITAKKQLLSKTETLDYVENLKPDFIMTLGAGDINQLVEPIKRILQ